MTARFAAISATAVADERFALLGWERHVDIETVRADHFAAIIAQEFGDHDDVMDAPLDVDDAVAGAERLMRSTDVVQCGGYLLVVLGMFMGQHHAGCWFCGAGFIAVQSFDFG